MRSNETITKYFGIAENSYQINFFDIKVNRDTKAFVDPGVLRASINSFSDECKDLIVDFFQEFLAALKSNNETRGLYLLDGLKETNYFHLGLSKEKSNGRSVGKELNQKIWDSFKNSKAAKSGFLNDIEDSALFIENIGPDRISDMVCAILREKFAIYTLNISTYYNMQNSLKEETLLCWENKEWIKKKFLLPNSEFTPLLFIPKYLIRRKTITNSRFYQNNYLFPHLRQKLIDSNSELVKILKTHNGKKEERKTVYNKDLKKKFGSTKFDITNQTDNNRDAYEKYKKSILENPPKIISLEDLAKTLNVYIFDPNKILKEYKEIGTDINKFKKLSDSIINTIFHGSLIFKENLSVKTLSADTYFINNFQPFFNLVRQRYHTDELLILKLNEELNEKTLKNIEEVYSTHKFKMIFCRSKDRSTCPNASIVIEDSDLNEIIYDYKEGILFNNNGFLIKHIK